MVLLHRSTRGHTLTPEGAVYLDGCRRAIDGVEQAEAALQTSAEQVAGLLRVSAPLAFGLDRITPILPQFLTRHPKVAVDLVLTDDSVNLIEDRIDLAIRMGHLADSSLRARRLCGLRRNRGGGALAFWPGTGCPHIRKTCRAFPACAGTARVRI